ncbi:MAG: aldose 1-epimerase family protein, partial [Chloroflexota bacterium]|nr:aldose 1-epimerase family protein [Chloroflexota bacterium]
SYGGEWHGDEYEMWVSGQLREAVVFGENLLLRRHISARLGEPRLWIEDTVVNEGFQRTPHMILYHVNFGFPLLSEATKLIAPSVEVEPRDERAAAGRDQYDRFQPPTAGFEEQVFYHTPMAVEDGYAQAALVNRAFDNGQGLGGYVRWRLQELPRMIQWKMMGQGTYACALEPTTNWGAGRAEERAAGRLMYLEPGEARHYKVEIGVLTSQEEIERFASTVAAALEDRGVGA